MKKRTFLLSVVLVLCAATTLSAQVLQRHVAEFRFGAEQFTTITAAAGGVPDGALIYATKFLLPLDQTTVFVTLSTTGDAHAGDAHWFSARVNGQFCSPGNQGAGFAPPGWIPLQKHFSYDPPVTYTSGGVSGQTSGDGGGGTGDMHDNGIYYTWCCPKAILKPGLTNGVTIHMATSNAGSPVFVERSHYYVDSVDKNLCTQAKPISTPIEIEAEPFDEEAEIERRLTLEANAANNQ